MPQKPHALRKPRLGTLIYGKSSEYEFADRTLEHLRVVIITRLRRGESFFLSWGQDGAGANAPTSLWISPQVPIGFRFSTEQQQPLSRAWIQELLRASHSPRGLVLAPEEHPPHGAG